GQIQSEEPHRHIRLPFWRSNWCVVLPVNALVWLGTRRHFLGGSSVWRNLVRSRYLARSQTARAGRRKTRTKPADHSCARSCLSHIKEGRSPGRLSGGLRPPFLATCLRASRVVSNSNQRRQNNGNTNRIGGVGRHSQRGQGNDETRQRGIRWALFIFIPL